MRPPLLPRYSRPRAAVALGCAVALLAGCGGSPPPARGGGLSRGASKGGPAPTATATAGTGGDAAAGIAVTKNTSRAGGADAIADAAAIATAVYPAQTPETHPQVVVLADVRDPLSAISAAQLMARPLRAPLLYSSGTTLPPATAQALSTLAPTGAPKAHRAQVIRIGDAPAPPGLRSTVVPGGSPAAIAQAVDRLAIGASGARSPAVIVAPTARPDLAMPAAGWAAKSGEPVLWADKNALPPQTLSELKALRHPQIYVLGPPEAISDGVLSQLRKVGTAKRIGTSDPVTNAVFFARYSDGTFGWNVVDPGHGLVVANVHRAADAAAAAPLSASGTYGPLLLVSQAGALPIDVQNYLLDIQPGYDKDPVRGVYNHAWFVGDESAVSDAVQSRIDALLEIQPVNTGGQ